MSIGFLKFFWIFFRKRIEGEIGWYRQGGGPGMPGPYGATDGGKLVMRAGCAVAVKGLVAGCIGGKYPLAHRAEKLYTDTIIMYGWNEP